MYLSVGKENKTYIKFEKHPKNTIESQLKAQQAYKPKNGLFQIINRWPGNEPYESLLKQL